MALLRMTMENYRCFKERQEIELRPITLVLGKNNSGKSAITRLPMILAAGIGTASPLPLDLDALGDDPPEFLDLVHGRNVHRPLKLGFTAAGKRRDNDDEDVIAFEATIQNVDEKRTQFVSDLEILHKDEHYQLNWTPESPETVYTIHTNDFIDSARVHFKGLIPYISLPERWITEHNIEHFIEVQRYWEVRYLGPYRQRPSRLGRLPSRMATEVGSAGENAAGMLFNDHVRGESKLIDRVNELLGNGLDGWKLEVAEQGPVFAVNLRSRTDRDLTVNLLDSGTGVAQVLPMLVQRARDMTADQEQEGDTLQVIEEPELHLHPAFHSLLADLFIGAAKKGSRFLIETHSETLLLRLRRRIAEGEISPDDVAIYFVEHHEGTSDAHRINIDELGNLDYWPRGVFSEDFEEAKALAKAQFDHPAGGRDAR